MKALSKEMLGEWIQAECAPEVRFRLRIASMRLSMYIEGLNIAEEAKELGLGATSYSIWQALRCMLADVEGLTDDNDQPIKLAFDSFPVLGKELPILKDEFVDIFPAPLLAEMLKAIMNLTIANRKNLDGDGGESGVGFTSDSALNSTAGTVPETNQPVNTDAPTG
ncbi:MAG TPA: hypothetical protein VLH56_19225 [Dissulfurispiraceae bacterium]|nr:hypothetical protein [Dissulfurispiraceae bacterium]